MQPLRRVKQKSVSAEACAGDVLGAVPGLMRFIRGEMRSHRAPGLTESQFRCLIFVSVNEDPSLSDLAEFLGLSLPAASRMVQLLVRRGLLERRARTDDRRRVRLSFTRKGRQTFQTVLAATQVGMGGVLSRLSARELAQVSGAMRTLDRLFANNGHAARLVR